MPPGTGSVFTVSATTDSDGDESMASSATSSATVLAPKKQKRGTKRGAAADNDVTQSDLPNPASAKAASVFDAPKRVTRRSAAASVPDPIGGGVWKSVVITLEEAIQNKAGLSKISSATRYTRNKIKSYKPHRLSDDDAKPILTHFLESDKRRNFGKSYISERPDARGRPVSVFGVAEIVLHERGITPEVIKSSSNQDNSHGFPQSSVSNPHEADQVKRMIAENFVGNQGTTREIERFMDEQAKLDAGRGNIGKMRNSVFAAGERTFAPELVRDSVLRRSPSFNHVDVLFSLEHNNADIDR